MKLCTSCQSAFADPEFRCPSCGSAPEEIGGVPYFAPELAEGNDGYTEGLHNWYLEHEDRSFWFRARNKLILHLLERFFPDCRNFCEVGCGNGYVLEGVGRHLPGAKLYASDVFGTALTNILKRVPGAFIFQGDARDLPFKEEFDVLGAFDVLEHITEDVETLRSFHRAVKPGGGVLIAVPQHEWLWSFRDVAASHKRRYSREDLDAKLRKTGFVPLYYTSYISFLLPGMLISKLAAGWGERLADDQQALNLPRPLDAALEVVCDVERLLTEMNLQVPLGGSLMCAALKEA